TRAEQAAIATGANQRRGLGNRRYALGLEHQLGGRKDPAGHAIEVVDRKGKQLHREPACRLRECRLDCLVRFGGDGIEALRRQLEHAERQPHPPLDLIGRALAPEAHTRDDHGLLTRHWMIGAAGRHTNTPPLPALPARDTSRRTSSPPWRWK